MDPVQSVFDALSRCSWFGGAAAGVSEGKPAVIVYTKAKLANPPEVCCDLPVIFRECGLVRRMVATRAVG